MTEIKNKNCLCLEFWIFPIWLRLFRISDFVLRAYFVYIVSLFAIIVLWIWKTGKNN